ncbi:MAG: helix-turn-helix domain-containing protein, partial [Candidatus Acidiferrales bacterium]
MRRAKNALRNAPTSEDASTETPKTAHRRPSLIKGQAIGLRERKKERLRQQIVETSLHLFRQRGYENTRIDDIVQSLEISQPTFFRYFPSKDAVLREVGR